MPETPGQAKHFFSFESSAFIQISALKSMEDIYDQDFKNQNFRNANLRKGTYEACRFENCDFKDLHLSQYAFIECEFTNCDLSNVRWKESQLQDCLFQDCKLIGLRFGELSSFGLAVELRDCRIDYSSLYGFKPVRFRMTGGSAIETDFSEAQLASSYFEDVNFKNAQFDGTDLSNASLLNASNLELNPAENKVKGLSISENSLAGLLSQFGLRIKA